MPQQKSADGKGAGGEKGTTPDASVEVGPQEVTEAPEPEITERVTSTVELEAVRAETQVDLSTDRLNAMNALKEEVFSGAEIREEREIPAKRDILKIMVQFGLAQTLEFEKAIVERVICDNDQHLLLMDVTVPTTDGSMLLTYTLKGSYGKNGSKVTSLEWVSQDQDGMPYGGSNIADYREGQWVIRYLGTVNIRL